jgi:hypothetical protein
MLLSFEKTAFGLWVPWWCRLITDAGSVRSLGDIIAIKSHLEGHRHFLPTAQLIWGKTENHGDGLRCVITKPPDQWRTMFQRPQTH